MSGQFDGIWGQSMNSLRARHFAADYTGVTHAGLALVQAGQVFLAQRTMDPTDDPAVQETWEFPGGSLDGDEQPFEAAVREFLEETGLTMPADARVVNGWRSPDGVYQGFVVDCSDADMTDWHLTDWAPTSECQAVGWFTRETMPENLRPEVQDSTPWDLIFADGSDGSDVSGNEDDMSQAAPEADPTPDDTMNDAEPDHSAMVIIPQPLMIHGVLAPEAAPSGDSRGFNDGALTSRPLRLPFGWQEKTAPGHNNSVTVGSIDRMMRNGGLIHWEGTLMTSAKAEEFTELLAFFGQYGVSIDGVNGSIDNAKSSDQGMVWFDAVQVAGAVACSIPAFAESYVALGPSPDMPEDNTDAALTASGIAASDIIGARITFGRGAGWVTDPKATSRIHDYWTKPGQPGYDQIGWGTGGDFARAKALIGEKIAKHSPDKMKYLNQIIAQWHHDALGYWPATHAKMLGGKGGDKVATAAEGIETDEAGQGWEAVLVSSAGGGRVLPPADYFSKHPDTGALVITEPDEFGIRRTYGYAGQWGVCHIGFDGRCVEVPEDPTGEYNDFHLGRTKTADGDYINTGVITYKVDHRDAKTILSQTAEQQHFDNIAHAWAAVRLGQDDEGVWFSGVVLPGVSDDDCTLIEATGQVSGEWKYGALRALQAVNVPGYPVLRSSAVVDEEGTVLALVASTYGATTDGCAPTPAERMAALAQADAEARFENLKEAWS